MTNTMTTIEKFKSLPTAMTESTRGAAKDGMLVPGGEKFIHFSDTAPRELQDVFLEHFEVRDIDYQIFSKACDTLAEVEYKDLRDFEPYGESGTREWASIWNDDRIGYVTVHNEDEISSKVREYSIDISAAAAMWFDEEVERAMAVIHEWLTA